MESKNPENPISLFVKKERKKLGYTQKEFSERAGVGYNFIRELEQGKATLRLDLVNQVLGFFGFQAGPVPVNREDSGA